jgi:hypothetical protein
MPAVLRPDLKAAVWLAIGVFAVTPALKFIRR